jgi:hypothetical protein
MKASEKGRPNKALQQNRDDVLRYGESIGCDLLKAAVRLLGCQQFPKFLVVYV